MIVPFSMSCRQLLVYRPTGAIGSPTFGRGRRNGIPPRATRAGVGKTMTTADGNVGSVDPVSLSTDSFDVVAR